MKYDHKKKEIRIDKVINDLDQFVIDFIEILEKHVPYVIVSGYVSILLGRTRSSEEVDLLVPKMDFKDFEILFSDLENRDYECANTSNSKEAYEMLREHAIRFFKQGKPIPNMEFKSISNEVQKYAIDEKIKIIFGNSVLFTSPLELQIAYKLSLMAKGDIEEISSDKDFEDAKHLYELFKEDLDKDKLEYFIKLFKVKDKMEILENG